MDDKLVPNDVSLPEHPDATQRRLRDDGEWVEAEQVFLSERARHYNRCRKAMPKGQRLSLAQRVECNAGAWRAVYTLYPVPEGAEPLPSLAKYLTNTHRVRVTKKLPRLSEAEEQRFDEIGDNDDHSGDVMWVYQNLEKPEVRAFDCPSRGAWFMLSHARRDAGWFYEKMYRPVAQQLAKQRAIGEADVYQPSKQEKMDRAELEEMIKEARDALAESAESA